jgi:hypothetical protein
MLKAIVLNVIMLNVIMLSVNKMSLCSMWWRGTATFSHKGTKNNGTFVMLIVLYAGCIEIGLEQAPLVYFILFPHLNTKKAC